MHGTSSKYTFHALLNTTSAYRAILMTFARCFAVLMELSEHYRYYCGHPEYVSAIVLYFRSSRCAADIHRLIRLSVGVRNLLILLIIK